MTQLIWFERLMTISDTTDKYSNDFYLELQKSIDLKHSYKIGYFTKLMEVTHS